jgi:hypothetical protein
MGWAIALFVGFPVGALFVLGVVHGAAKLSRERTPQ